MLTAGQHKTLKFIRKYIDKHAYSPTLSEIAIGRGLSSKGSMHRDVQALATAGYIKLLPGRKRGIQLVDEPHQAASTLPLLGRIAAGKPIEAIPDQDTVNLTDFVMGQNRYCLLVMGDSMIGIGILAGAAALVSFYALVHLRTYKNVNTAAKIATSNLSLFFILFVYTTDGDHF